MFAQESQQRKRAAQLGAGVALYTANVVDSIQAGVDLARQTVDSGAARAKLDEFVRVSQQLKSA